MPSALHCVLPLLQVPYGQVRGEGHEGLVDFGAAALEQPRSVYAPPPYLFGPTPVSRFHPLDVPHLCLAVPLSV